jgi:hypothetical protein
MNRLIVQVCNELLAGRPAAWTLNSDAYRPQTLFRTEVGAARTIGIHAFPPPGVLPSKTLNRAMPHLTLFEKTLPPGYRMQIGREKAKH